MSTQTETQLEMLRCILEEIATNANMHSNHVDSSSYNYTLSLIMQRIGYLADFGISKIDGAPEVVGDADDWFLGRSYREQKLDQQQDASPLS